MHKEHTLVWKKRINNNPGKKDSHLSTTTKVLIQFLKSLLFQSSGKDILHLFVEKMPADRVVWDQYGIKNTLTGNLHHLPVIKRLPCLALSKTDLMISVVGQLQAPPKYIRKNALQCLLLPMFLQEFVEDLLFVNENTVVDRNVLERKLGHHYDVYFGLTMRASFIELAMKL